MRPGIKVEISDSEVLIGRCSSGKTDSHLQHITSAVKPIRKKNMPGKEERKEREREKLKCSAWGKGGNAPVWNDSQIP